MITETTYTKDGYSLFYTFDGPSQLTTLNDGSLFFLRGQTHFPVGLRERYVEVSPADGRGANKTRKKDSLRCKYGVVYTLFYGRIRIPRNLGNIDACADSVYPVSYTHLTLPTIYSV